MKFVSTFNTLSVLVFSMAAANNKAVRSVKPTFVNDSTSKFSLSGIAFINCSSFSSEIFCKQATIIILTNTLSVSKLMQLL